MVFLGLDALINMCATWAASDVAHECPSACDPWWNDIVLGPPEQLVKDSMIDVLAGPRPGLTNEGITKYSLEEDAGFFD